MDRLLTTEEVAAIARVSPATVRFWRAKKKGPFGFRLGRKVVYTETAVQEWLQERQRVVA